MRTGTHGTAQTGKTALLTGDLVQVVAHLPQRLLATRYRALAPVAYAGGLRRSELAAAQVRDQFTNAGCDREHTAIKRRPGGAKCGAVSVAY